MTVAQIENRLTKVERTFADLTKRLGGKTFDKHWYINQAGRFADDPLFDEIVRLGQEARRKINASGKVKRARTR
jgi:hypothetical protein